MSDDRYRIRSGDPVLITDANGDEWGAIADSALETTGHSFPVIWVVPEAAGADRTPWPAESVRLPEATKETDRG